ncbi:hypothetical protein K9M50_02195 [Patescibacteria group bacterium]|nr:hypothetical protein [Patescibacteria group bacterium]
MRKAELVLLIEVGVIIILLALITFHTFRKDEVKRTEKEVETEEVQPEKSEKEASKDLEEDLENLIDDDKPEKKDLVKEDYVFAYEGKPDLSFVEHDFGVYLTPVTKGSNTYVPIKFFTKSYIKKLSTQVPGLEPSSVPMTDKENPTNRPPGKAWNLDKSETAYYFVDFGQKVKKTNNKDDKAIIPLNAYAGKKPGGYEIWLMYEAAVLNKQGFTQHWDGGNFISNGDGGFDYAGIFSGFKNLDK